MSKSRGRVIHTIGHSTLEFPDFVARLRAFDIRILADIRSLPGSRRHPQFDREELERSLPREDIEYVWLPALGGRRSRGLGESSPNTAWRHPSFRNYADYMLTPEFAAGIDELLALARRRSTCIMCAEAVYWRCHRRLVSDYLLAHGVRVEHIMSASASRPHTLTPEARLQPDGTLIYPAAQGALFPPRSKQAGRRRKASATTSEPLARARSRLRVSARLTQRPRDGL
jgi:uncharacterized protein (DUF488 family)